LPKNQAPKQENKPSLVDFKNLASWENALLALFLVSFAAFAVSRNPFFFYSSAVLIILVFLSELTPSSLDEKGLGESAKELVIAFAGAFAFWLLLGFALGTSTPLDVVTSCSMLPNLDRGDLVILQGGEVKTQEILTPTGFIPVKGFCSKEFKNGTSSQVECTTQLQFTDQLISLNPLQGDTIVFEPTPRDFGLIIHRAVAKYDYNGVTYYLTKGDNNQIADVEWGIKPVPQRDVKGRVLFRIPLLGFVKIFLFQPFSAEDPQGCEYTTLFK
jgi:signal peptidase I